jgi:PAS domain S-box-containing protein
VTPPPDSGRLPPPDGAGPAHDAIAAALAAMLGADTPAVALAAGLRSTAALFAAEAAALLPLEGGDPALEIWHPDTPAAREQHRAAFLAATSRTGAARLDAAAVRILPLVSAGAGAGALCLGRAREGAPPDGITHVLAMLAALAATQNEAARAAAARREYERWFKTMDDQVRVLERERQKFAALVHRSDAEVFVTDRSGLIRWTNSLLASHPPPGPAGGSWIGQGCAAVCSRFSVPGVSPECGDCPVARAVCRNEVVHHEFRRANHHGSRTLYLSALPIKGPDGLAHEVLVMVQDLSDLEVLRRSESRYRLLFERSAKAIVIVEPATGRIIMANPMASRMTGLTAEELSGRPLEDLHPPGDWPALAERYRAGLAEGTLAPFECRIHHRGGPEVLATVSGTRYDLDGQDVEMLEFQDVTETRRVTEALRHAEERLRSVVANAPVILFAIDAHGVFTLSEGRGLTSLGLRPGQVVGRSAYELYQDHPQVLANIRRAMEGEEFTARVEVGDVSLETWYTPTRNAEGRPDGVIGVSNDVSQRRRLEDQLRQAQKMEAIGRLAGGVAHDFNNLLAAIMGHGELLLRRLEPTQPQHRHAEAIQKAAARGALLTRQLLAFSRKEVLAPTVLDLHLVVAEMEEMLRRLIGEHIELVIVLGDRPDYVRADRGQLEQVIMNLAVNARDAMVEGGVLRVEVAASDLAGRIADGAARSGPFVTVAVSDTGCGMDSATAARIFEPFFTTKEQGKGTGLGLSTVYGIVEQSGGFIEVDSAPGRGTTFTVFLPRLEERARTPGAEAATPASMSGDETVLLVEDEAGVRAVAREALESHGYRVLEARNGVEALEVARGYSGRIDLLVTDIVMPLMGGRELAQHLRAARPAARVLFMSGYTDDVIVRRGVSDLTSAFLQKPFAMSAFARKVRETLDIPDDPSDRAAGAA